MLGTEPRSFGRTSAALTITMLLFIVVFVFKTRFPLSKPACPGTHFVDQAVLEFRDLTDCLYLLRAGIKMWAATCPVQLSFLLIKRLFKLGGGDTCF